MLPTLTVYAYHQEEKSCVPFLTKLPRPPPTPISWNLKKKHFLKRNWNSLLSNRRFFSKFCCIFTKKLLFEYAPFIQQRLLEKIIKFEYIPLSLILEPLELSSHSSTSLSTYRDHIMSLFYGYSTSGNDSGKNQLWINYAMIQARF